MKYSIVTIAILAAFQPWTPILEAAAPPAPDKTATPKAAEKLDDPLKDAPVPSEGPSTSTCTPGSPGCGNAPTVYYPAPSYYASPSCDPNSHQGCGGAPVYYAPPQYPPNGASVCGVNGCGGGGPSPVVGPYYASPYPQPQYQPQYQVPFQAAPPVESSYPPPVAEYQAPPPTVQNLFSGFAGFKPGEAYTNTFTVGDRRFIESFSVDPASGVLTFGPDQIQFDASGRGTLKGHAVQLVLTDKGPKGAVRYSLVNPATGNPIVTGTFTTEKPPKKPREEL